MNLKKKFDLENMKKLPLKIAHNGPPDSFSVQTALPKQPKTEIPCHQKPLNPELGIKSGLNLKNYLEPAFSRQQLVWN